MERSGAVRSLGGPVTTVHNHQFVYPDFPTGYTTDLEVPTYYQSFKATGNWVSSIGYCQSQEFGLLTTFSILQDGPLGSQIGPSRTISTSATCPSTAYWNAGEVPLTPGQIYCVKINTPWQGIPGVHCYCPATSKQMLAGASILNGNAYPDGQTWRSDENDQGLYSVRGPVLLVINQDTDGVTTTLSTRKTNDPNPYALSYTSAVIAGQTFTAKGSSLLSFSCLLGNVGTQSYYASVFTGPGTKGTGSGTRIGPRKFMQGISNSSFSGCVWKPGEVPLTPGQQYYICLQASQSQAFTIYTDAIPTEKYPGGSAYIYSDTRGTGGVQNYDLSTTMCEESYSGSTATPNDAISNVVVTPSTLSATISWQTATASNSSTFVQYGGLPPYGSTVTDSTPRSTSHSVTLTGLTGNMLYHARITAVPLVVPPGPDCYTIGTTRDFVFVTNPNADESSLITNGGFENGTQSRTLPQGTYNVPVGWTLGFEQGNNFDVHIETSWLDSIGPHGGNNFVGGALNGSAEKAFLYQTVTTVPGFPIYARAWLATYQQDHLGTALATTCRGRIGIDPTGGTDCT